ncbi:hypothetical protein EYZ11_010560 [Aspergillus tanneri]|nr:hypothetical protein EYZ11_010560 [Aspergillus tanneri]
MEDVGTALSGLAEQFRGGYVTIKESWQLMVHRECSGPWRAALTGMIEQNWNGECTTGDVVSSIISAARGQPLPMAVCWCEQWDRDTVIPTAVIKRTTKSGKDCFLTRNMASVTGTACAIFMETALELTAVGKNRSSIFAPEDWAEPSAFYQALSWGRPVKRLSRHCKRTSIMWMHIIFLLWIKLIY